MRGLTVALMILVNNGGGSEHFSQLVHSKWNGLTLCDLVFPFFLFMVGVSIYLAFRKYDFKGSPKVYGKILKRTVRLFLIGLAINWLILIAIGRPFDFAHLRIWAVLQRIALCYGLAACFAVSVDHKWTIPTIIALLVGYSAILIFGNGYAEDASNILARVDKALFGSGHLYAKSPVDPEGLLGTISGVAHTLIGFYCGKLLCSSSENYPKSGTLKLVYAGIALTIVGYALQFFLPLNKRIWSPSYVCVSCGYAALLLSMMMYIIDIKGHSKWAKPFLVFGMNALFLYVLSDVLSIFLGTSGAGDAIYNLIATALPAKAASLAYAILVTLTCWAIGYPLYRKKIFIKL